MSAAVLALPTSAPGPVAQRQRRGPLPKAVRSLSAYRLDRKKGHEQVHADKVAKVKEVFFQALERVLQGEVTGVAILETREGANEGDTFSAAGEFVDDPAHFRRCAYKVIDLSFGWHIEENNRLQSTE
ncbi:hypothetical protein NF681_06950 [Comamonadaceae bacterium OTU4NAUVB1]|nr:hypothetical protein NF681_06950 [Comamonadaceae bacterium OTU4NAUVB1]